MSNPGPATAAGRLDDDADDVELLQVHPQDVSEHASVSNGGIRGVFYRLAGFRPLGAAPDSPNFRPPRTDGKWCPEQNASFVSRLLFLFVNSLMALGSQKHLEAEDLWDLASQNEAVHITSRFEACMRATACARTPYGSVWRSCLRCFFPRFAAAGGLKLLHDCVYLSSPFVLRQLLLHLQQPNPSRTVGVGWAFLLFLTGLGVPLIINQYFYRLFAISLHAKTSLIHTLYSKALRISMSSKSSLGSGAITNLQSNDAAKVFNLPQYGHILWSAPLQLVIIVLSLHLIIGWLPALAGLAVTLTLVPINTLIGKYQARIRKQLVKATDKRVKAVSEVVTGIKAIKLYAWEVPYTEVIRTARAAEQRLIRKSQLIGCFSTVIYLGGPVIVALVAFSTYIWLGRDKPGNPGMTAAVAFPALALFDLMRLPIIMLPMQIMNIINAHVALSRMQKFVDAEELVPLPQLVAASPELGEEAVKVTDGTFAWDKGEDAAVILRDINLSVPSGSLVMVAGEVGAGKSSLVAAILNEMYRISGEVVVRGSVAYTAQDPWIQNNTVEGNILMGLPMDEERYGRVLAACALDTDLDLLPAHDQTEIGEKGVNLSGGQKHRIALARAAYADADVYLLDDPLSAVDASVGRHLFEECFSRLLANKTRILVTHQVQFLEHADLIVMMQGGRVTVSGSYDELLMRGVTFADARMKDEDEENKPGGGEGAAAAAAASEGDKENAHRADALKKAPSVKKSQSTGQLAGKEDRSKGSVDRSVYISYLSSWGPAFVVPVVYISIAVCERGLQVGQNFWLSVWSNKTSTVGAADVNTAYYLTVYFSLGLCSIVFQVTRATTLVLATIRASSRLHDSLLTKVVTLPMSFFDTQPSGRLLNRFTRDVENLDISLQQTMSSFVTCSTSVAFSFLAVVAVTRGAILLAAVPLFFLFRAVQQYYLATSRELKRLDSVAMSPIFSHFTESLNGLLTVRAFRRQELFSAKNETLLDRSNRAWWPLQVGNRWLSIRLEGMGQCMMLVTAIFVALFVRDGGLAGFALTAAINLISLLTWATRQSTELEISMNSVERLLEYQKYESEQPAVIEGSRPPPSWPSQGAIDVSKLCVAYRPELPLVLKDISFNVISREKVGVCGRTGCGKSTLMMTLYRIIEPLAGSIKIDGIEVTKIGLYDLRSKLSLVPQDPVVFTGTVRSNLDPFNHASSDLAIWEALRQAGLDGAVKAMDGGLDSPLTEGGANLSVGQRQLLCMARALLRRCSILLMDEATSNVDNDTDRIIQQTIRSAFKECTVLTIAHRLHTIVDSDRILMLDQGEILEYGSPDELLVKEGGGFQALVRDARAGNRRAGLTASKSSAVLLEVAT